MIGVREITVHASERWQLPNQIKNTFYFSLSTFSDQRTQKNQKKDEHS